MDAMLLSTVQKVQDLYPIVTQGISPYSQTPLEYFTPDLEVKVPDTSFYRTEVQDGLDIVDQTLEGTYLDFRIICFYRISSDEKIKITVLEL